MSFSPTSGSREATPTSSGSSLGLGMDQATTSSGVSIGGGSSLDQEDAERFRKRMELEQAMQTLQQRLKLASVKAENGWVDMSINEIETRLPPTPQRGRRSIITDHPVASTSALPYEPPSPSRPWQLIDVLWQPLPPPSHSRTPNGDGYPSAPCSPLKRSRVDEDDRFSPPPKPQVNGHARRASGSAALLHQSCHPHAQSPIALIRSSEKRRSNSQSYPRSPPTTQDVDAAKALTSMLGSGSPGPAESHHRHVRRSSAQNPLLPPLATTSSLPLTLSFEPPGKARAKSAAPKRPSPPNGHDVHHAHGQPTHDHSHSHSHSQSPRNTAPDDADKDAAELMMYLAHSPSPMKKTPAPSPSRMMGGAARVLFADGDASSGGSGTREGTHEVEKHSNLALAPPITAEIVDQRGQFGLVEADA